MAFAHPPRAVSVPDWRPVASPTFRTRAVARELDGGQENPPPAAKVPFDRDKLMRSVEIAPAQTQTGSDPRARSSERSPASCGSWESSGESDVNADEIRPTCFIGKALKGLDDVAGMCASPRSNPPIFARARDFHDVLGELKGEEQ